MAQRAVLLISDIVDSTRLASTLGDEAFVLLFEEHDRIVQQLANRHRGRELSRSDGVVMRFQSVAGAVAFAAAYHRDLAAAGGAFRVRIGIHTGPVELRNADELRAARSGLVPGLALAMTARVSALASGGQTLISGDARKELDPTDMRVMSHGHWRLKGIAEPVELFEAGDARTLFSTPPDGPKAFRVVQRNGLWLPRREVPHSLPAERDRFIGRDEALYAIGGLVEADNRCITIVGSGGVGKTRAAQRFGWRWLGDFAGGVWYCDLAQATTCDGLVSSVAQGLTLQLGASSPIEQIAEALKGRGSCLVILDNFEQITHFARETLGRWLDAAAGTRFIVTSRNVLGIAGETVHRLGSMKPNESADLFAERAMAASGAVVSAKPAEGRADALQQRFARDAETIATLVRLLDGNPLAIELAAARLRVMDLPTLLHRMQQRFNVLARSTGRVARHATLRATLDWSWDLLSSQEKFALAQASVFEGGFDLVAFEAVVTLAPAVDAPTAIDVLQALVEKSLIQQSSAKRFGLLLSVQEYAREHLGRIHEQAGITISSAATIQRHARHYAMLDETEATADRCVEIDNLVAAVRRSITQEDAGTASLALVNCWAALKQCGPYRTGASLASEVRQMQDLSEASLARVNFVGGSASQDMGDLESAATSFRQGIEAARRGHARYEEARLLRARGELELEAGRHEVAAATLGEALALAVAIDDALLRCIVLNALGTLAQSRGENRTAFDRYGEALALAERVGHRRWAGALLGNMGIALYGLDDRDGAKSHYVRSLEIANESGDERWIGNTRSNLGLVLSDQGRHQEARVELDAALKIARHLGHLRLECIVLWNVGISEAAQSHFSDAAIYYGQAYAIAQKLGDRRSESLLEAEMTAMRQMTVSP